MPPRRRKAHFDNSTSSGSSASAAKRVKSDSESARASQWQWEADGGEWKALSDEHNEVLTEGFVNGEKNVVISLNRKVKFDVDMQEMCQRNKTTGWRRNVRCADTDGTCSEDWEWRDENGVWVSYSSPVARRLEAGRVCAMKSVEFSVGGRGREYILKIDEMKQVNVETKVERDVQRNKPGSFPVWEWEDENGDWSSYSPSVCRMLESSFVADPTQDVNVTTVGRSYTIHLAKMKQENDETGVVRRVRKKGAVAASVANGVSKKSGSEKSGDSVAKRRKVKKEEDEEDAAEDTVKSVQFHGKAPIDSLCASKQGKAHVYYDGVTVWDAMLNQTNLQNNNNKYYVIQLLEDDVKRQFSVWMRWGRVGFSGQNSLVECGSDIDKAKQLFEKKFLDKTKNEWSDRGSFVKCPGKYDLLQIDYTPKADEDEVDAPTASASLGDTKPQKLKSQLDKRVQQLIELICNTQAMEDTVIEMKYDTKKAPLGKLTKDQIKAGYAALKKIDACIEASHYGDRLVHACDEFYTRIPHAFGMTRPPPIRTKEQVKAKMALLEALGDIEIAMRLMSEKGSEEDHPIDRHYASLKCQLTPLDKEIEEYKLVERYVKTTHAKTHNQYSLDVLDVFSMDKKSPFSDHGNRMLLWHGSRLSNWVGILSEGLRIAPPEAPVTGYMFGKGVYFADICSKSANYCFATRSKDVGLLLLCDVSLGTTNDLIAADYAADELPPGKQSVMGKGKIAPNPANTHKTSDGCVVPLGPTCDTGMHNPHGYTLNYNEYVVYDVKQIKMRYLVKLKFNFK